MSIPQFFKETYKQHQLRFTVVTLCLLIASFLELISLATLIPLIGGLIENQTFQEGNTLKFLSVLGIEKPFSISIVIYYPVFYDCAYFLNVCIVLSCWHDERTD